MLSAEFPQINAQHRPAREPQHQLAQNETPQPAAPPQLQLAVPSDDVLLLLIRATLIAVNQANVTGNYSVLRDLAAPGFKEANSPDKLAQDFANMRNGKLDLAPTLLIQPKLLRRAEITPKGNLRITGFFPTEPERIKFDLVFQPVQGRWRLLYILDISGNTAQVPPAEETPQAAPAEAPDAAAAANPGASPAASPAAPEPKKAKAEGESVKKQPPKTEVDVRDRLDNPPSPPPEDEKPKEKSFWNPFSR